MSIIDLLLQKRTTNILMMGGRRCGKTSLLASMFDEMIKNDSIADLISFSDQTIIEEKTFNDVTETQDKLNDKILELRRFTGRHKAGQFIVDQNPTRFYWDYISRATIQKSGHSMQLIFRDAAGEFFDHGGKHHEETSLFLDECDIYIIVIDTPYLMSDTDEVAEAANVTSSIHSFISEIFAGEAGTNAENAKMVIFAPIKCEKWIHEGKIDDVIDRIDELYKPTITRLKNIPYLDAWIIPVETAGGLESVGLTEPKVIVNKHGQRKKCVEIIEGSYYLADGSIYDELKADENVDDDPESVFVNNGYTLDFPRPYSWFKQRDEDHSYHPNNCDQIVLHILQFMLKKLKLSTHKTIFGKILSKLGTITLTELRDTMNELNNKNIIQNSGKGIKCIRTLG